MLNKLTVQQKIVFMVILILIGSMATSMIAYVSFQKLQRVARVEHERILILAREGTTGEYDARLDEAGQRFQETITYMTRQTLQLIITSTAAYIIIGVLLAFFVARSISIPAQNGSQPSHMSPEDLARVLEKLAQNVRTHGWKVSDY